MAFLLSAESWLVEFQSYLISSFTLSAENGSPNLPDRSVQPVARTLTLKHFLGLHPTTMSVDDEQVI
ncbi:hypothetical protein CWM47_04930 [Spirosoma pollinicola]|uniref:Uncharacterized protein n=1 Tax=Spirosoma pollinicola TaxID=2057025 RepID=A0A2K8YU94_9BACT|nr:hypothetical protein CWM47_04930 [Spirosoma pollinicola]